MGSDCTIKRKDKNKSVSYELLYKGIYTDYTEVLKGLSNLDKYLKGECIPVDSKEFIENVRDILGEIDEQVLEVSLTSPYQKEEVIIENNDVTSFKGTYKLLGNTFNAEYTNKNYNYGFTNENDLVNEDHLNEINNINTTILKKIISFKRKNNLEKTSGKEMIKERGIN